MVENNDLRSRLAQALSPTSFEHSERTAATAVKLAKTHSGEEEKALIAGLVHDVGRDLTDEELLKRAKEYGIEISAIEAEKPYLVHAAVSAAMAAEDYEIVDESILSAVENHTFGQTNMSKLDKIVFLADMIEPKRDFNGIETIRDLVDKNLDKAFAVAFQMQLVRLINQGKVIHPKAISVWNSLAKEVGKK